MNDAWTIQRILDWTQQYFHDKHLDSPRLDAEVLLAAALSVNRVYLYTHYDKPLSADERDTFRAWVKRRAAHEPVSQILGVKEFFSREFEVNSEVLAPRPETEHLVDAVLEWVRARELEMPRILDVGTGSGAIAVTLAAELSGARITAVDISETALATAEHNVRRHHVADRVELMYGDLFAPVSGTFDVVVSNPPYIDPDARERLAPEVRDWEPAVALFAGDGGLAVIRRLVAEAPAHLTRPGLLAFEIGYDQGGTATALFTRRDLWSSIELRRDLRGLDRVLCATLGPGG